MSYNLVPLSPCEVVLSSNGFVLRRLGQYTATPNLEYTYSEISYVYSCTGIGFATAEKNIVIADVFNGARVTSIGSGAFQSRANVETVVIPATVKNMESSAFAYCTNLRKVTFAETSNLQFIGTFAFRGCQSLTSITIPDSVTTIGGMAFDGCSNLCAVRINSLDAWCRIDFDYYTSNPLYSAGNLHLGHSKTPMTEIVIPGTVYVIKKNAFAGWMGTSITIPSSVWKIESYALYGCDNLASIKFDGTVEQWKKVERLSDWCLGAPATEVVCSDGTWPL